MGISNWVKRLLGVRQVSKKVRVVQPSSMSKFGKWKTAPYGKRKNK